MTTEKFNEKIQSMRPMLMEVAQDVLENKTEADDVVQDALLRLWQMRDEPIRNLEGLAKVVVRHLSIDALRRRTENLPIHRIDFADESPPEGLSDEEEQMMAHIRQLPVMQQTLLRLRHVDDMETGKIAALIGMTESAVRQSLSRARRKILLLFTEKGLKR